MILVVYCLNKFFLQSKDIFTIMEISRLLELIISSFYEREFVVGGNDIKDLFIYSIDEEIPEGSVIKIS